MTLRDIGKFMFGSREAILRIAGNRRALAVGFVLVISGGIARHYDAEDLSVNWRFLFRGLAVSIVNSLTLYSLVYVMVRIIRSPGTGFWSGYVRFLATFWMTAPIAWLYAIPYERFMTPAEAIHANLITLSVVSVWRVLLSARALSEIFNARFAAVLVIAMFFSDVAIFVIGITVNPTLVLGMGGVQSPTEELREAITVKTYGLTLLAAPVLGIASVVMFRFLGPRDAVRAAPAPSPGISAGAIAFVALALLGWIPALIVGQREQRLRTHTEQLLRTNDFTGAIAEMSSHARTDYPPAWELSNVRYDLLSDAIESAPAAPWVREFLEEQVTPWRAVRPRH